MKSSLKINKGDFIGWKDEYTNITVMRLFVLTDPDPKSKEFSAVNLADGTIEYDWYEGSYSGSTNWVKMELKECDT